jgi:predicted DNA-binding transcriptional regulator AlpA
MAQKTTEQAANELGMSRPVLINYITRHPELRPQSQLHKAGLLMWTDEEIEAVREARANRGNGRPKKQ